VEARGAYSVAMERRARRLTGGPGAIGYAVAAALVGVALLLYFLDGHTNLANGGAISSRGTGFVIGEASGIAAAVLLATVVILASRLAVLELLFGDLTSVYVAHGVIGLTMFAVVSIHPMMYLLGGLLLGSDFLGAAHVLVPFHVVVLDWVSYIVIAIALIPTLYMRLSFDNWRWIHLLLGLAMILTGYSILIDNSAFDTSAIPVLRDYLFVVFGLATAAFLWVAVVRRVVEPKREYRIVGVEHHPEADAIELLAEPVGRPARFEAGQFIYVDLLDSMAQIDREFEAHPFSVVTPPGSEPLSLVIEATGRHTQRVKDIAAGDEARALLHGAYGRLGIGRPGTKKQLWLAGGIGITPFLAMAGELRTPPRASSTAPCTWIAERKLIGSWTSRVGGVVQRLLSFSSSVICSAEASWPENRRASSTSASSTPVCPPNASRLSATAMSPSARASRARTTASAPMPTDAELALTRARASLAPSCRAPSR
jgi:predicted ferric reductase